MYLLYHRKVINDYICKKRTMWYRYAAVTINNKEIPEEDFFNSFSNVASNDNEQHFWIVNGEKYAPPKNYGHQHTSMMLKLKHGMMPGDADFEEHPIEFVGRGLGQFAQGGTVRVTKMIDMADITIYGPTNDLTLNNIIKFVTPDSINKWQILNVPNNPHGSGFDSLKQSINNLSLQNTTNVKEDIDIAPIQRVDNTPSFYKGRSGD